MKISFKWKGDKPEHPAAATDDVEGGLQFALDHLHDPRGIRDKVVTAHIALDNLKFNVVGVGWSKNDEERLVVFKYSIIERISSCVYYESPS